MTTGFGVSTTSHFTASSARHRAFLLYQKAKMDATIFLIIFFIFNKNKRGAFFSS